MLLDLWSGGPLRPRGLVAFFICVLSLPAAILVSTEDSPLILVFALSI